MQRRPGRGRGAQFYQSKMESKWTPVKDEQGRTYYWNESTHETSWNPPLDVVLPTDQDDFKHDVEELFCTLDKNGDGVLSFEEFSAWVADVTSVKPDATTAYFDFADSGKHISISLIP